jgi:NCS2 family nucleobase:cation symporter-2
MAHEVLLNPPPLSLHQRVMTLVYRTANEDAELYVRKKPSNLVYDVDEVPPAVVLAGHSLQHIFLMSLGWLYIAVIVNAVGGTQTAAESLIRMSMIAGGLATMLQASRTRMGSGYLCPVS